MTIGIFEATKTTRQTLIVNLNNLLDSLSLRKKIIAFVKDEGVNFNTMTSTLRSIMSCGILRLEESFNGSCFKHVFSKACQYGTVEGKVYKDMRFVQLRMHNLAFRSAQLGRKNPVKVDKSGTKHVWRLKFSHIAFFLN
jgi:hypothetical protein